MTAEVGNYVAYTGNNGCPAGHCDGTNANYENDTVMGWCGESDYKFKANGWRIMAKDAGGVYIVSAGAPECMCTNSDGTKSDSSCSTSIENANSLNLHINNLNEVARSYCNTQYAKNATCNETTAWAMSESDYQRITGNTLSSCEFISSEACGLTNTLIDNSGFYWYANAHTSSLNNAFYWDPYVQSPYNMTSNYLLGVRPVLYLESGVSIVGGEGTYASPYQLSN